MSQRPTESLRLGGLPPEHVRPMADLIAQSHWLRVEYGSPAEVAYLRFGRAPDGRVVVNGLMLGVDRPAGEEITARRLRRLPLAHILAGARIDTSQLLWWIDQGLATGELDSAPVAVPRPGPKGHSERFLQQVAEAYRKALAESPRAPVRAVCRQFLTPGGKPTPEPTVRRWLQRARDRELLGPSVPGKAGEFAEI